MDRGHLVQAPMGSGKTTWIKNLMNSSMSSPMSNSNSQACKWLDGDELLKNENIKNRNYFWYDDSKKSERLLIENKFEEYLEKGFNILYSGNPLIMKTSLIILPDFNVRYDRLQKRDFDYRPMLCQTQREEVAYREAAKNCKCVESDTIPSVDELEKMLDLV
jgi:hypothetical protein